ncbi:hypothetical protein DC28_11835 [Spirochaeta lutea]|uniref:Major facilitator superfamily (MFS) profile domain-containing protein n=2 Tax=Spirochaeta lutea TaxID=1480694 RepID=A0A098QUD5_9SPIO|nr:hypothetical protein DC28_11835 [Spirochaeta lutea]
MKRYGILAASVVIQLVLGSVYAWSTIAQELTSLHGFAAWQTQFIYGMIIFVFSVSLILGGRLFRKRGPRYTATWGGILFGSSYLLAAVLPLEPLVLIFLLGGLSGFSIGLGYACPLSTGVAWFPKHKGLVTGVAVFGFGGGAILANQVYVQILASGGSVQQIFLLTGAIGGGLVVLSAQVLALPDKVRSLSSTAVPAIQQGFLKSPSFWRLALGLGLGSASGLLLIGRAAGIAVDLGFAESAAAALPAMAVAAVSVGNASGRLFWGWLNDRIPGLTIPLSLGLATLSALGLLLAGTSPVLFIILMAMSGLLFGGSLVVYAAHSELVFGQGALARVYPFIFMFYGAAAIIGPSLGGVMYDVTGNSTGPIILAAALPFAGLIMTTVLRRFESTEVNQAATAEEQGSQALA